MGVCFNTILQPVMLKPLLTASIFLIISSATSAKVARINNPLRLAASLSSGSFQKRSTNAVSSDALMNSLLSMSHEEMAALEYCYDMFSKYQDLSADQLSQVSLNSDESEILDKCYVITQKVGMKKRSAHEDQWMNMFKRAADRQANIDLLTKMLMGS